MAMMNKTVEKKFEELCTIMTDEKLRYMYDVEFEGLCERIGASPERMENILYERFGMSGDELLEALINGNMQIK
ncbi:MAG: hypothetical protein IJX11_02760 [Bacteroidales bacterium]|nr:hypothetical protein [Bacteroidales bacterium]